MQNSSTLLSTKGEEFLIEDVKKWEGVFLVISTTCGACFDYYSIANEMSINNDSVKHIALLVDTYSSLEEYEKGILYKSFGFLNDKWIVLPADKIIEELNKDYDIDKNGYPFLFYRKDGMVIEHKLIRGSLK